MEKFWSSATFFIFIICAQDEYLWSYDTFRQHVKSYFFANISFESTTSEFTEKCSFYLLVVIELPELHPYPYLYGKKTKEEVSSLAPEWVPFAEFSSNPEWTALYNQIKSSIPSDNTGALNFPIVKCPFILRVALQ